MAGCFGWGNPKTLPLEPTNGLDKLHGCGRVVVIVHPVMNSLRNSPESTEKVDHCKVAIKGVYNHMHKLLLTNITVAAYIPGFH